MPKSSKPLARRCVVQALYQWRMTEQSPAQIRESFIAHENLRGDHLEYFQHLIERIPANIETIDQYIAAHIDRDISRVDFTEQAIMRLAVYELEFARDLPVKVVLNEAVELARLFCSENGYKYVNAVLDKIAHDLRGDEFDTPT